MVNVLAWITLGALAGWLSARVLRGPHGGVVGAILVGVLGAVIAGVVFAWLLPGAFGLTQPHVGSWGVAALGAIILLFLVQAMAKTLRNAIGF